MASNFIKTATLAGIFFMATTALSIADSNVSGQVTNRLYCNSKQMTSDVLGGHNKASMAAINIENSDVSGRVTNSVKKMKDVHNVVRGIHSDIYSVATMKIQCGDIDELTGTAYHSEGEVPIASPSWSRASSTPLAAGWSTFPSGPTIFAGILVSGYPVSRQKLVPDVVLSGGIAEFDRGLATVDRTRKLDTETKELLSEATALPGRKIGIDYEKGDKWSKAKIAVDFNPISYQALCGIPKMQASNGITVYKGISAEEFGFTLFGPTIGLRGSINLLQVDKELVGIRPGFFAVQAGLNVQTLSDNQAWKPFAPKITGRPGNCVK